ncbi:MAG: alkaline phosphatase family protein [Chloroflexota bacterium]
MSDVERLISQYTSGTVTRGTFVQRLLALGVSVTFAESLLGMPLRTALAAPPPNMVPSRAPYVVMVVMDAFRADYLNLAPMPNLEWLMTRGTTFTHAWVGQLESYTPTSHATLSTGATPGHQGVIGFSWRDPQSGQETYTGWYDDVMAGRLELQLLQHGVNSIPEAVKRQDPTARVVALSSEKYYAADAMGGPAADYILYGMPQGSAIVTQGIPHHVPPDAFLRTPGLSRPWPMRFGQFDHLSMTMAIESLRAFDPRVLMINLPGPDIYGHRVGGPARSDVMTRIIRGCDRQLGRLFRAFRDRGILDQTIFVVTGDHGMASNTYQIDDEVLKQTVRDGGGDYLFHTGGNSAFIWLRNPPAAHQVAAHLVNTLHHAPFAHVMTIEGGKYVYRPVLRSGLGHGPRLEAAYQYLLGTFAGPLAPDISLAFDENTITRVHNGYHGEHGGATWAAQQVPLVIAGPRVRRGVHSCFPARLMDVAPTILGLLGIPPTNMDGIALADAFRHPTKAQELARDELAPSLIRHQRAIIARSSADIEAEVPLNQPER